LAAVLAVAAGEAADLLTAYGDSRGEAAAHTGRRCRHGSARAETYHRLGPLLTPPRPRQLDGLLDVDPDLGITRLTRQLRRGATAATPEVLKAEIDGLEFLRRHGAGPGDAGTAGTAGTCPTPCPGWPGSAQTSALPGWAGTLRVGRGRVSARPAESCS
jgi:hypothetical protein